MPTARPLLAIALAALAAGIAACGGGEEPRAADPPPVRLTIEGPDDLTTTRDDSVTVRGSVDAAGAAVRVLGKPAEMVGGTFTARVLLSPGANVIDVAATAPRRSPAMTALRVTREMLVTVPDLSGLSPDDARAKVQALGLRLEEKDAGGLLEELLPGDKGVCEQRPAAGQDARRGTAVTVLVSKQC